MRLGNSPRWFWLAIGVALAGATEDMPDWAKSILFLPAILLALGLDSAAYRRRRAERKSIARILANDDPIIIEER